MGKPVELILGAERASWSVPAHHGTEIDKAKKMVAVRASILKRDRNTCQGCGWSSRHWQEIHHRNGDHSDFSLDNLATLCPLCHQIFHLPTVSIANSGTLIWLPEMSQKQLNQMLIPAFVALESEDTSLRAAASILIQQLEARKLIMEEEMGASDPGMLAQMLIKLTKEEYQQRSKFLASVRLLAFRPRFMPAIEYWLKTNFAKHPPGEWDKVLPKEFELEKLIMAKEKLLQGEDEELDEEMEEEFDEEGGEEESDSENGDMEFEHGSQRRNHEEDSEPEEEPEEEEESEEANEEDSQGSNQ